MGRPGADPVPELPDLADGLRGKDAAVKAAAKATDAAQAAEPLDAVVPQALPQTATSATNPATPNAAASAATSVPAVTASGGSTPAVPGADSTASAPVINVRTDVLDVDVSQRGGELQRADLLAYPVQKGKAEVVRLLRNNGPGDQYLLQSGLAGIGAAAGQYPTHLADFQSDFTSFVLQPGDSELRVPLKWTSPDGVVTKTLVFHRGGYRVDVEYAIANLHCRTVAPYEQILHDRPPVKRSYFNVTSYAFWARLMTAPSTRSSGDRQEDANLTRDLTRGYCALQHHFVTAIAPAIGEQNHCAARRGTEYMATVVGPSHTVGESATLKETVFVGPKLQQSQASTPNFRGPRTTAS
jgi:YidC/Oxa1 family membrane protein insertase